MYMTFIFRPGQLHFLHLRDMMEIILSMHWHEQGSVLGNSINFLKEEISNEL